MVVAFPAIGCFEAAEPTPIPTATMDVGSMVRAAIATALGTAPPPERTPTSTLVPVPTATPAPQGTNTPVPTLRPTSVSITTARSIDTPQPVATPPAKHLQPVDCINCDSEIPNLQHYVDWIQKPSVSTNSILSFQARIDERANFIISGYFCGFSNITLTDQSGVLYGTIDPLIVAYECIPLPSSWYAEQYHFDDNMLTVMAQVDPAAATHPGLELCLWTGGVTKEQNRLMDCIRIQHP